MAKGAKKGAQTALQTEATNDDEWKQIRERKGLVVVDVYSDWAGPCQAMVPTLRKIKMEIGGDVLTYAVARNDEIASLERFRGCSEPVWMFLQNGKLVNLMFGAHCPKLQRMIVAELKRIEDKELPKRMVSVTQRLSIEESRWQKAESKRKAKENQKFAREEATKKAKYEAFLDQMMFELCEECAVIVYPWVFLDEDGYPRDKESCPAYTELVRNILPERCDILEQYRVQLDEDMISKLFVESDIEDTNTLIQGLTQDKCTAIRLRVRAPPPEWPVVYPNECPEGTARCPIRAINDAENFLRSMLETPPTDPRSSLVGTYMERHFYVYESEEEEAESAVYPAVWIPPNARNKVHVFKTVFRLYMERAHPYEEPVEPPPLCAFKFEAPKFGIVREAYENFSSAIEKFGVFEFDDPSIARRIASTPQDFEDKVLYKTGNEIFVIILRRVSEEVFYTFAGSDPLFATEDHAEAEGMIEQYFPPGATDVLPESPFAEEDYFEDYDDEDEGEEDEYEAEDDDEKFFESEIPPSFVDLSMF